MRIHGGSVRARLDFSVNTNPLGPPEELYRVLIGSCAPEDILKRYPDYSYRDLRRSLSEFYGIDEDSLLPLNGSSEGFTLALLAFRPRRVLSIEPTFGDHMLACRSLGIESTYIQYKERGDRFILGEEDLADLESLCRDPYTMIYMSNPNNPTGSYIDIEKLYRSLDRCRGYIVIDEAYAELCDICPLKPVGPPENVVILRSLTKWLSIPGIRLGFLYSSSKRVLRVFDDIRPPWNVNSIAECVISKLLARYSVEMKSFIERSRGYIAGERGFLLESLRGAGVPKVYRSVANYILTWFGDKAEGILDKLVGRGISLRDCSSFTGLGKGYLRISVRVRRDNEELITAIRDLLRAR
ncbi:MAG: histidinol-phosphate transaminase [Sulfolobales archaeon]